MTDGVGDDTAVCTFYSRYLVQFFLILKAVVTTALEPTVPVRQTGGEYWAPRVVDGLD